MNPRRTLINFVTFLLIAGFLIYYGTTRFLYPPQQGQRITMTVANASGLLPRSDVTVRGVPSGAVSGVTLTGEGNALVSMRMDPGITVPVGTTAEITRRSPIGDITVNLIPGDGPPMEDGGHIPMDATVPPPDAERTIEVLAQILEAVPPEDLDTVVSELATGLRGRGQDLARLSEAGADLPERILEVRTELESLIRTGPEVLDVLAENAPTLGDDITQTALLADILRDRRFDLVQLMRNGADLSEVLGELLATEKPNLACMVADYGKLNDVLARPKNLRNLADVLDLNHFFFDGVEEAVREGHDGLNWFRVHFLEFSGHARAWTPHRQAPDVFGGLACTSRYGRGVGPARQAHDPAINEGSRVHLGGA